MLHELSTCLQAPTVALSGADGQIRASGAQGVFSADVRVLSRAEVSVAQSPLEPIATIPGGADRATYIALLRRLGGPGPDPTVWLRRSRTVRVDGMIEQLALTNASGGDITVMLILELAADLADIDAVKSGGASTPQAAERAAGGRVVFFAPNVTVAVTGAQSRIETGSDRATLEWALVIPARGEGMVEWSLSVADGGAAVIAAPAALALHERNRLEIEADDRRLAPFLRRSIADLGALRMATPGRPRDVFSAAGSPWYLTLFGRDSIWAARMSLPLGIELAAGTLRTLAARQGSGHRPSTAEEPGKILHELRRPGSAADRRLLPPVYYGTVDATPLWVCLLSDAWRWGMPETQVRELLPAAERALHWITEFGDSDGDGFLEYIDTSGRGLTNQGWKDSGDSIRFTDGRIATGPVALAEVQGYAYQAALAGAELLAAFGRPGADRWRDYAADLAARFRESFWVTDDLGAYPALALDGEKNRVDAPASNMGHLLATGILDSREDALVAERLVHPSMTSGFGLRTMSDTAGGYSPLSYHCGSVWPHDTAIAVHGLLRAGFASHATTLASGLLAAGDAFGGRLPELYGGFSVHDHPVPVPYPAACRPQAWSAAAPIVLVQALLGLEVDAPNGVLTLAPTPMAGRLAVHGLNIAGYRLDVQVDADGTVGDVGYDGPLTVSSPSRS